MEQNKNNRKRKLLIKETENLFEFAPARQLRKSLHEVYAFYLQEIDVTIMDPGFNRIAEDFYCLYKFLERVEEMEEE
jgi:hypothetical protein